MSKHSNRRQFLRTSALAGAGFWLAGSSQSAHSRSANEKLNIGLIGVANRAEGNIAGVQSQNVVAMCDIDDKYLAKAATKFPSAALYADFRKLLDQPGIDAVVVSTPDHTHAVATVAALKSGRHVYCEKPLAHSVYEARVAAETAAKYKRATQMGTQIHAEKNYRRVVEIVQAGTIGPVRECHVWCGKNWGGGERPSNKLDVPANIHWDLWLGPAPERPYHSTYLPGNWRRWWDFGGGTLGDMACHYMDLPFWALKLRHPQTIEAQGPPVHPETAPTWLIVNYEFGPRDDMPPVKLSWYDSGKRPELFASGKLPKWGDGVLFVGDKGMLIADYDRYLLLPESEFSSFKPPAPTIPNSIGHHAEWIEACKHGTPTTCNFDYSGALSEAVLLGNVAYRTGQKLQWDPVQLKAANCPAADQFVRREYRKGWSL